MSRNLSCRGFVWLLACLMTSVGALSRPRNLTVTLLDYRGTAHWEPGRENPDDTRYTLEIATIESLKEKWNQTEACTDIISTSCPLTFGDPYAAYYVRAKATRSKDSSGWTFLPKSFQPYGDTEFSAPDLKVSVKNSLLMVQVSHSLNGFNHVRAPTQPKFNISLFNSSKGRKTLISTNATKELSLIFPRLPLFHNYCVTASVHSSQPSKYLRSEKCVFLDVDRHGSIVVMIIGICLLLIVLVGLLLYTRLYLLDSKTKNHSPKSLDILPRTGRDAIMTLEKPSISSFLHQNDTGITEDLLITERDGEMEYQFQGYVSRESLTSARIQQPAFRAEEAPPPLLEDENEEIEDHPQHNAMYRCASVLEDSDSSEALSACSSFPGENAACLDMVNSSLAVSPWEEAQDEMEKGGLLSVDSATAGDQQPQSLSSGYESDRLESCEEEMDIFHGPYEARPEICCYGTEVFHEGDADDQLP